MKFNVKSCYSFDLLNFLNTLTGDEFYKNYHSEAFELFYPRLDDEAKESIQKMVDTFGRTMLSPVLNLIISSVPDFESMELRDMLKNMEMLEDCFSKYVYYDKEEWESNKNMLSYLMTVVERLEKAGFREYWFNEKLPLINEKEEELRSCADKYNLQEEIENMLGSSSSIDEISVYLCAFARPHGIKICGPRYISDVSYSREDTLSIAVHEMFHPPYNAKELKEELEALGGDELILNAFINQDPSYAYSTMEGFLEENVVEAMAIFICHRIGLKKDPYGYLVKHDKGSHVFSVVLFDYFTKHPKKKEITFQEYFMQLLKEIPVGSLRDVYNDILKNNNAALNY